MQGLDRRMKNLVRVLCVVAEGLAGLLAFNRRVCHIQGSPRILRWFLCGAMLCAGSASAQDQQQPDLSQLGLEDLMKLKVDTVYGASKFLQKVADAPASVTIVTGEEIQKHGYRTLADALRSVRGFYVIYDRNYSYVGVRGFSRPGDYNARILFLLDGHRVKNRVSRSLWRNCRQAQ